MIFVQKDATRTSKRGDRVMKAGGNSDVQVD